ncbi:hypothetical protein AZE42_11420 [Rhizopogon vesiculosus]|uniref:Uncharacterized protein n=1 Tax=Rhizopogon vesiculosus TaxID=180088 RepID=A0A1J8PLD1_9AGAM|nr:hypothetical protein AZE42_11420 [Rhizopogon vesiculosus]
MGMPPASNRRALTITAKDEDVMSPDELLTPPVFNYSRCLQWASTAETIFQVFQAASEKAQNRIPICLGSGWVESNTPKAIHPSNRRGPPQEIALYCAQSKYAQRSHWAPGVFTRMAIASCVSIALQWGTTGAAMIVVYFTPTTTAHGVSIAELPHLRGDLHIDLDDAPDVWYSCPLLRIAQNITVCTCCTDVLALTAKDRGKAAYAMIIEPTDQAAQLKAAWAGTLVLASTSALIFIGIVNLLLDTLPS